VDGDAEREMRPLLDAARDVLELVGCEAVLRAFDPPSLPALLLVDRSAAFAKELRATRERVDGLWSEVLGALDRHDESAPQLVLNHRSPLIRRLASIGDRDVVRLAVEGLYGQALLAGQHPIKPTDSVLVNRSFLGLLERAVAERSDDA
jgi:molecular chaperone HtpG